MRAGEGHGPNHGRHLYFAQSLRDGTIKIGASGTPERRVRILAQAVSDPMALLLVCWDMGRFERDVHREFAVENVGHRFDYSAYGGATEWFRPSPRLLAFINEARRDPTHVASVTLLGGPCCELCAYLGGHPGGVERGGHGSSLARRGGGGQRA